MFAVTALSAFVRFHLLLVLINKQIFHDLLLYYIYCFATLINDIVNDSFVFSSDLRYFLPIGKHTIEQKMTRGFLGSAWLLLVNAINKIQTLNRSTYLHVVSPTCDRTKQRKLIGECEILESVHRLHHFMERK